MARFPRGAALAVAIVASAFSRPASSSESTPVPPELMEKLGRYAQVFETERLRASYRLEGELDVLNGSDQITDRKELVARVDGNGGNPEVTVLEYREDGKDKTADAVRDARANAEKRRKRREEGKELKMPILPSQQSRYVFEEVDESADQSRVLVRFTPKEPADDTVEGSAWVDVAAGTPLSASFKPSRTSVFVNYVHVVVRFAEATPIGPAVSTVSVDGEGGVLFFRKHFRGMATLSQYTLAP